MSKTAQTTDAYDRLESDNDYALLTRGQYERGECPRCAATPGVEGLCNHIHEAHGVKARIQYRCDNCDALDVKPAGRMHNNSANYCSQSCVSGAGETRVIHIDDWPEDDSRCPTCRRPFETRKAMLLHHTRTHNQTLRVGRECQYEHCDEQVVAAISAVERGKGKYCSKQCQDRSRSDYVPIPDVVLVAPTHSEGQTYHTRLDCGYVSDNNWTRSLERAKDQGLEECSHCKERRQKHD